MLSAVRIFIIVSVEWAFNLGLQWGCPKQDLPNKRSGLHELRHLHGQGTVLHHQQTTSGFVLLVVMFTPFGPVLCLVFCWWHTRSSNPTGWAGSAWEVRKANSIMGAKQMKWYEWNSSTHRFPLSSSFLKFHFISWMRQSNRHCLCQFPYLTGTLWHHSCTLLLVITTTNHWYLTGIDI